MEKKTEDLIQSLTEQHQKKPFWKTYYVLLTAWLVLNLVAFIFETMRLKSGFHGFNVFLFLNVLASALSWFYFTRNLNQSVDGKWNWIALGSLIFLAMAGFVYSDVSQTISHERSPGVYSEDWACFKHIVLLAIPAAIFYPFYLKNFFVTSAGWTLTLMVTHISLLSIGLVEGQCPNREFWHLVIGHQTSYIGVAAFFILSYILVRKRVSSVV